MGRINFVPKGPVILYKSGGRYTAYGEGATTIGAVGTALIAAQTAAASGDVIYLFEDAAISAPLGKNGVTLVTNCTITAGSTTKIISDQGSAMTFTVHGNGRFISDEAICIHSNHASTVFNIFCQYVKSSYNDAAIITVHNQLGTINLTVTTDIVSTDQRAIKVSGTLCNVVCRDIIAYVDGVQITAGTCNLTVRKITATTGQLINSDGGTINIYNDVIDTASLGSIVGTVNIYGATELGGGGGGGGGGAPTTATYITQTTNGSLSNEQALASLATGILLNTTGTGVLSIATAGTDYLAPAAIGTTVQAYNANLTTFAGIAPSANVQTLLGAADYTAFRTSLGLVIGTNVQAYDADLTTYASITPSANVQSLLGAADYAAMRTQLGLVIGTNVQAYAANLTSWAGLAVSSDFADWMATPNSANFKAVMTDETGSGALVFATSPTLVTPILGTPTSGTLTNCTLPVGGITGLGTDVGTFLATPSSANFAAAITDEVGTGFVVLNDSPVFTTQTLFPNGSVTVPSIGFSSDADGTGTGLYRVAANQIGITCNGVNVGTWASTGLTVAGLATITQGTANAGVLASTGYSLTGSDATSMINLAGTWNTTGTPSAINLDITNTASNAASNLINLKVGGSSRFRVTPTTGAYVTSTDAGGQVLSLTSMYGTSSFFRGGSNLLVNTGFAIDTSSGSASFLSITQSSASRVDIFTDGVADTWSQRRGTNAQAFNLYNTYTSGSVYERLGIYWSSHIAHIGAQHTGATARALQLDYGGTTTAAISIPITSGNVGMVGLTLTGGTVTDTNPVINVTQTWNDAADIFKGILFNFTNTASHASSKLFEFQLGGTHSFSLGKSNDLTLGVATIRDYGSGQVQCGNIYIAAAGLQMGSGYLSWHSSSALSGAETIIYRDAAYTLGLRNTSNAHTLNIYNTYTNASNYERFGLAWTSNVFYFGTLTTGGTKRLSVHHGGAVKTLTDNTLTTFCNVAVGSTSSISGTLHYSVKCEDGSQYQCRAGTMNWVMSRETGNTTVVTLGTPSDNFASSPSGGGDSLTVTFATTGTGATIGFQVTANSSLTPSTMSIAYRFVVDDTAPTFTPV